MIKVRQWAVVSAAVLASPAVAQQQPGQGVAPAPGSRDGAAVAMSTREESASYNSVIGKVGAEPVKAEKARREAKAKAVPATAADILPGAAVRDINGAALGMIEKLDGDSAILTFSTGKIRYPIIGFGKDTAGLLINLSTKDFLAAVAKAKTAS